jgi:ribosomal protein L12E/L44/L45/RPP1/RPP2
VGVDFQEATQLEHITDLDSPFHYTRIDDLLAFKCDVSMKANEFEYLRIPSMTNDPTHLRELEMAMNAFAYDVAVHMENTGVSIDIVWSREETKFNAFSIFRQSDAVHTSGPSAKRMTLVHSFDDVFGPMKTQSLYSRAVAEERKVAATAFMRSLENVTAAGALASPASPAAAAAAAATPAAEADGSREKAINISPRVLSRLLFVYLHMSASGDDAKERKVLLGGRRELTTSELKTVCSASLHALCARGIVIRNTKTESAVVFNRRADSQLFGYDVTPDVQISLGTHSSRVLKVTAPFGRILT